MVYFCLKAEVERAGVRGYKEIGNRRNFTQSQSKISNPSPFKLENLVIDFVCVKL
jgi:hypothetical protein